MSWLRGMFVGVMAYLSLAVVPAMAAAQSNGSAAGDTTTGMFNRVADLLVQALEPLGIVVFLAGIGLLGVGASSDRSATGMKLMLLGFVMYVGANSISWFKSIGEYVAPSIIVVF